MQTVIGIRFLAADEPHFYFKSYCRSSKKVTQIGGWLTCSESGKIANIVTQRKKNPSYVFYYSSYSDRVFNPKWRHAPRGSPMMLLEMD